MSLSDTTVAGIGLALVFELAMHVFVHYTVPGANFAAGLAESLAPALDAVGLTTVFSHAAAAPALPMLGELALSTP
jgi:hypothetical protein